MTTPEDQAKLSTLQGEIVRFLQDRSCNPYGLIHEFTFFHYQNIRFEMQLTLLLDTKVEGIKYRRKSEVVEAIQFNYIDNIDGPKTCELAKSLGLSRNKPHSLLWEIKTPQGWKIVRSGDWIITNTMEEKWACSPDKFELLYEPAT